ncbi:MAG: hypothetical protein KBD01_01810 [Acidobacteria bacterium]|nr:hypothetical protein [Acidobacteriota bacterium]
MRAPSSWSLPILVLIVLAASGPGCNRGLDRDASLLDDGGGRTESDFPELTADVFKAMDGGIELTPEEIAGRNTWNLWCGGNEQFWDRAAREGYGLFDLLMMLDSRKRDSRFRELGVINEPGYRKADKPDKYGLWLDVPVAPETAEPASIDPAVYGRASGVMGFRIFDNPEFDAEAAKKWDPQRFYNDPSYTARADLVRPYRVGVSCGSCHIAFHPSRPPDDPENPRWENLASAIGNQYIREGRVFGATIKPGGFFHEMTETQPPGTSDTSRIATDHINNPNAINPIFELGARLAVAHDEELADESVLLPASHTRDKVPHVLKDGADSVGVLGATVRVYVNIGLYSQHWLAQHNALLGLRGQEPFSIKTANENSVYWRATVQKAPNIARFFSRLKPYRLADAPGGAEHMTRDPAVLERGKLVFADHCAGCHSGKRPPAGVEAKAWFQQEVLKPDFLEGNFLSSEERYPVSKIGTNAARAAATNAMSGHVWQNFSSRTYKELPPVDPIEVYNPYTGRNEPYTIGGGGRGYYRVPSLISVWSSAPLLHNNALGKYTGDPSVAGRMEAFNDAIEKLLWPEKRLGLESIWRTQQECALQVNATVIPEPLRTLLGSHIDPDGFFRIGFIPAGTPVNLIANLDPATEPKKLAALLLKARRVFRRIKEQQLDGEAARQLLRDELAPDLYAASSCPDLVEDRGHTFGADLPDGDKRALIEFIKTF